MSVLALSMKNACTIPTEGFAAICLHLALLLVTY